MFINITNLLNSTVKLLNNIVFQPKIEIRNVLDTRKE